MIAQLLLTLAIMAALMVGYYLVQRGLRRVSPEIGHNSDVLETRWGCGLCLFKQRKSCPRHGRCRREAAAPLDPLQ